MKKKWILISVLIGIFMINLNVSAASINWDWCKPEIQRILGIAKLIINIIRWIVPIGLIVMTTIDVFKNVINPESKDGMKKIGTRIISAVIVFLVPFILNLVLKLVSVGDSSVDTSIWSCWDSATPASLN